MTLRNWIFKFGGEFVNKNGKCLKIGLVKPDQRTVLQTFFTSPFPQSKYMYLWTSRGKCFSLSKHVHFTRQLASFRCCMCFGLNIGGHVQFSRSGAKHEKKKIDTKEATIRALIQQPSNIVKIQRLQHQKNSSTLCHHSNQIKDTSSPFQRTLHHVDIIAWATSGQSTNLTTTETVSQRAFFNVLKSKSSPKSACRQLASGSVISHSQNWGERTSCFKYLYNNNTRMTAHLLQKDIFMQVWS